MFTKEFTPEFLQEEWKRELLTDGGALSWVVTTKKDYFLLV